MNRHDLIEKMAKDTGESKAAVDRFLDSFITQVTLTVAKGGEIKLSGFGKFERATSVERVGHNPASRERLVIPATNRPRFTPGEHFKKAVRKS